MNNQTPITPDDALAASFDSLGEPTTKGKLQEIQDHGPRMMDPHEARSMLAYLSRAKSAVHVARARLEDERKRAERAAVKHEAVVAGWRAREAQLVAQATAAERLAQGLTNASAGDLGHQALALLTRIELAYEGGADPVTWRRLMDELGTLLSRRASR